MRYIGSRRSRGDSDVCVVISSHGSLPTVSLRRTFRLGGPMTYIRMLWSCREHSVAFNVVYMVQWTGCSTCTCRLVD
jgi:hypothetical protein